MHLFDLGGRHIAVLLLLLLSLLLLLLLNILLYYCYCYCIQLTDEIEWTVSHQADRLILLTATQLFQGVDGPENGTINAYYNLVCIIL